MRMAWIGIGLMGRPMAARLAQAGHSLFVWNRTEAKAAPLADFGATICAAPEVAFHDCEIAITMLSNAESADAVIYRRRAFEALKPHALLIDMSSTAPEHAREQARVLNARGVRFIDAPVSGGTRGARDGTLTIFAGGEPTDVERAGPVLSTLGTIHHMGPIGAGQLAKLTNQIIVAGTIAAVAEGLAFAERAGLDVETIRNALGGGFADSRVLREHGERMSRRDFTPGAPNTTFLKDLNIILDAAEGITADVSLTRHIHRSYKRLIEEGQGALDHSSLILNYWQRDPR